MRATILVILVCLAAVGEAAAMEALWGRVVSIDRQERQMAVRARPMRASPGGDDGSGNVSPGKELTVKFDDVDLPHCVAVGTVVRLWGNFSRENPDVFDAAFIRGAGRRSWHYDPTGVRQRLGMGRGGRIKGKGPPPTMRDGEHPSCIRTEAQ